MAGGQAITSAAGSVTVDGDLAVSGEESTSAQGATVQTLLLPLRSRKVGGGTATITLGGQVAFSLPGSVEAGKGFALVGSAITSATGTLSLQGSAFITWNPNSEPDLAGYRVQHGTLPTEFTEAVTLGLVTSYVWNGLAPGFTHYFFVEAYDTSNNFSLPSAIVSKAI